MRSYRHGPGPWAAAGVVQRKATTAANLCANLVMPSVAMRSYSDSS